MAMVTLLALRSTVNSFERGSGKQPCGSTYPFFPYKLPPNLCLQDLKDEEIRKSVTVMDVKKG